MSTFNNPALVPGINPLAKGALYQDRQVTNLADPKQWPAAIAANDLVQVGVIPAGCTLVPELCNAKFPILDSNGAPTGTFKIGTAAAPTAIMGTSKNGSAAVSLRGSDFANSPTPGGGGTALGSPDTDIPIYLDALTAFATVAVTGKIVMDLVLRAYETELDAQ